MNIIIRDPHPGEEDSITISVREMTENVSRILNILKGATTLKVHQDGKIHILPTSEIFYIESVDHKTFVCTDTNLYQSKLKLYELSDTLDADSFLYANRQTLLNVNKIMSFAPSSNRRLLVTLTNGDKILISRQYVPDFKEAFGI